MSNAPDLAVASSEQFDVVIVGGGLVGTSLAAALADSTLRIGIVEARVPEPPDPGAPFESRVCALSPSTRDWLTRLGAWSHIESARYATFDNVRVWDGEGTASVHFSASEIGTDHLGYIVENGITQAALAKAVARFDNVEWIAPERVVELERADNPRLSLESGRSVAGSLIVGADGALSRMRTLAGYHLAEWNYGHAAIVGTVRAEKAHGGWALHRFSSTGPLAFLPLPDPEGAEESHYYSIVWCDTPDRVASWMEMDERQLADILEQEFESRVGSIEELTGRASFPLRQRHALGYVKRGIALIGDAAHTIHPLAGQGVNIGFRDARVLAEAILDATRRGRAIGNLDTLNRFQVRRVGPNVAMAGLMEGFKQLFALTDPRVRWLRNLGIRTFDRQATLKREIVRLVLGV